MLIPRQRAVFSGVPPVPIREAVPAREGEGCER
jgi:hypothetical protein